MLGAAIGDTVGSVYEFNNTKNYDFELFTEKSGYTDDTVMTMAVAQWLLSDPAHSFEELEHWMFYFASNCPCINGGYGDGFWTWLFEPEYLLPYNCEYGNYPYKSKDGRHPYGSWGNGSAMRVSAVGWFFDSLDETERVAKISAEITHNHPEGIKGAQATVAAIWMARNNKEKSQIKDYIEKKYGYNLSRSWTSLHETYDWDSSCQGSVPPAMIAFLESDCFEDAIRKAVSLGGDSDTLACITGGIAEAYYKSIPEEMVLRTKYWFPKKFNDILAEMKDRTSYGLI